MSKITKPTYDFSYVKEINPNLYNDFEELINAFQYNYVATIKILSVPLFEKGFKYFLEQLNLIEEWFYEDPSLTDMVLSSRYAECRSYLQGKFILDYDLLATIRNASNNKKHDTFENFYNLNKKAILHELFSFYTQLYKELFNKSIDMPSEQYLDYISSFENFREERISEVESIVEEAKENLNKTLKQQQIIDETITLSKDELKTISNELRLKREQLNELNIFLEQRKVDIKLNESSKINNDLFVMATNFLESNDFEAARRVFTSIQSSNISDLRAFIGLLYCEYHAHNIDELMNIASESNVPLSSKATYLDIKFLKTEDREFIESISNKIENNIIYNQIKAELSKGNYTKVLDLCNSPKPVAFNFDLSSIIKEAKNEPQYKEGLKYFQLKNYTLSLTYLSKIDANYKDVKDIIANCKTYIANAEREQKQAEMQRLSKQGFYNLSNADYNRAADCFKKCKNYEMEQFSIECAKLKYRMNKFVEGQITRENIEYEINKYYSGKISDEVLKHFPDFSVIEQNLENKKIIAEKTKSLSKLENDFSYHSFDLFLKLADEILSINYIDSIIRNLDQHLYNVLEKNNFDWDFVTRIISLKDTNNHTNRFEGVFVRYVRNNMQNFSINNLNKIKTLDTYIKYSRVFYSFKLEAEKEISRRYEIKRVQDLQNKKSKILFLFNEAKYEECLSALQNLDDHSEFTKIKINCHFYLNQTKEILNYFVDNSTKSLVVDLFKENITNKNIGKYIDLYRKTTIESYLISTYITNNIKETIYETNLSDIKISKYFKNSINSDSYINIITNKYLDLEKQQEQFKEKAIKNTVISIIIQIVLTVVLLVLTILTISKSVGMPTTDDYCNNRKFWYIALLVFSIIAILTSAYSIIRYINAKNNNTGIFRIIENHHQRKLKEFKDETYPLKLALIYGYDLDKSAISFENDIKTYPIIECSTTKKILLSILVVIQIIYVSTFNAFLYKNITSIITDFDSKSLEVFEWSLENISSDYKDIKTIKKEYDKIKTDIYIINAHTHLNYINTRPKSCTSSYLNSAHSPKVNNSVIKAYQNIQCFMYANYDLSSKNKYNTYEWDLWPILDEVNMYYFISHVKLYEQNSDNYLWTTPTDYYSTFYNDNSSGQFGYNFFNGILELYTYNTGAGRWYKKWTLSDLTFTSSSRGLVLATKSNGSQYWLEFYLD